jgi:hypothetical protein
MHYNNVAGVVQEAYPVGAAQQHVNLEDAIKGSQ